MSDDHKLFVIVYMFSQIWMIDWSYFFIEKVETKLIKNKKQKRGKKAGINVNVNCCNFIKNGFWVNLFLLNMTKQTIT